MKQTLYSATGVAGTVVLPNTHRRYRFVLSGDVDIPYPQFDGGILYEDIEIFFVGDVVDRNVVVFGTEIKVPANKIQTVKAVWNGDTWFVVVSEIVNKVSAQEILSGNEIDIRNFSPKDIYDIIFSLLIKGAGGNFCIRKVHECVLDIVPLSIRVTGVAPTSVSGRFYLVVLTGVGSDAVDVFYDTETAKLWCIVNNAGVETRYSVQVAPGAAFDQTFTFSPAAPYITYGFFGMDPTKAPWPGINFRIFINA